MKYCGHNSKWSCVFYRNLFQWLWGHFTVSWIVAIAWVYKTPYCLLHQTVPSSHYLICVLQNGTQHWFIGRLFTSQPNCYPSSFSHLDHSGEFSCPGCSHEALFPSQVTRTPYSKLSSHRSRNGNQHVPPGHCFSLEPRLAGWRCNLCVLWSDGFPVWCLQYDDLVCDGGNPFSCNPFIKVF